jgi:hypothetical protein
LQKGIENFKWSKIKRYEIKILPNSIEIDGEPLELSTIIAKCSEAKVKEEKLVLLSPLGETHMFESLP